MLRAISLRLALKRLADTWARRKPMPSPQPEDAQALNDRGEALLELGRFAEALAHFDRAILRKPDSAPTFNNRGRALKQLKRLDDALASYDQAIALQPDFAPAFNSRGNLLRELDRWDEAVASFDRVIALQPDYPAAIMNRGMIHLLQGRLRQGWADYEWRRKLSSDSKPDLATPTWQGEALQGRSILVRTEQGLGDIMQFARYLPLLARRGGEVTCQVPPKLARLLGSLDPRVAFIPSLDGGKAYDFQCALMSLPDRFGTDLSSIPSHTPYLHPEDSLVRQWRARLGAQGFKVGINWHGSPERELDRGRGMPLQAIPGADPGRAPDQSAEKPWSSGRGYFRSCRGKSG